MTRKFKNLTQDQKAEWDRLQKADFKVQLESGWIAWFLCAPAIPWISIGDQSFVSAYGWLNVLLVFAIGLAVIWWASRFLSAQAATKALKSLGVM